MTESQQDIAALENAEQETDPEAVYEDIDRLPSWWQNIVREFESNDLRPYRPAKLSDDEIVPEFIETLGRRYEVDIRLKAVNPTYDGEWAFFVDGEPIVEAPHERKPAGFTRYGITSEELEEAVADAVEK